jgi:hypothetical protein
LFILIILNFEKKISLSFIIPDTENLVPLDANDQYYTDMFNPFKKINESKSIIKIIPDGFLQPPPVRFNNAIKIIKNNEISMVYIGHLSDLILNSLGDLNNTKNKQLKNLIYYLKRKNISISSAIDIERCVEFLSHNYDYGLKSFFLSVDEAIILIKDKNFKLEDILLCKKNLKNINSKINISLDLYIESFVADKSAYAKLVNLIKNFDPSCTKLYDLSGQVIPMINAENNYNLPLNSGIRGLNSNFIYLETCKKINLNDVSVSN